MKRTLLFVLGLCAVMATQAQSRVTEVAYKSELLGTEKYFMVYVPDGYDVSDKAYPVLYLLHGAGDNHTGWQEKGMMRTIVDEAIESGMAVPMIVVMPDASGVGGGKDGGSTVNRGYFNQQGWPYEDHFFGELIPFVEKEFRVIADRGHRAVSGLSMGGGGTAAYAQRHPEVFGSAVPMSGALGSGRGGHSGNTPIAFVENITPEQLEGQRAIRWMVDCGDDDFLWETNVEFFKAMKAAGIPVQFRMRNGGHNWEYWQTSLADVLTFVSIGFAQ